MTIPKKRQPSPKDVFLIKGEKNNQPEWYYVWVEKIKQPLIKKLTESHEMMPEELGEILLWGIGEEPPLYYQEKVAKGDFSS